LILFNNVIVFIGLDAHLFPQPEFSENSIFKVK
jgi:hypothetical protein